MLEQKPLLDSLLRGDKISLKGIIYSSRTERYICKQFTYFPNSDVYSNSRV